MARSTSTDREFVRVQVATALSRAVRLAAPRTRRDERVQVAESLGRRSAANVVARAAVPSHDQALMDGIAVQLLPSEIRRGGRLGPRRLTGRSHPGALPESLPAVGSDTAVEIFTGGPLPPGADTVVRHEVLIRDGNRVRSAVHVPRGRDLIRRGSDFRPGSKIVAKGEVVRPWHVAALLANGCRTLKVVPRPRLGILATGSELESVGRGEPAGRVRDTSRPLLIAMAREFGAQPVDLGLVPDSVPRIRAAVRKALPRCDVVITIGGSSRGLHDHVHEAVGGLNGVRWAAHGVRMRPGGTSSIAVVGGIPVFLLGGPPVAAFSGFVGLVERFLERRGAGPPDGRGTREAVLAEGIDHVRGTRELVRLRWVGRPRDGRTVAVEGHGSSRLSSLTRADALLVMTEGRASYRRGERVSVIPLSPRPGKDPPPRRKRRV